MCGFALGEHSSSTSKLWNRKGLVFLHGHYLIAPLGRAGRESLLFNWFFPPSSFLIWKKWDLKPLTLRYPAGAAQRLVEKALKRHLATLGKRQIRVPFRGIRAIRIERAGKSTPHRHAPSRSGAGLRLHALRWASGTWKRELPRNLKAKQGSLPRRGFRQDPFAPEPTKYRCAPLLRKLGKSTNSLSTSELEASLHLSSPWVAQEPRKDPTFIRNKGKLHTTQQSFKDNVSTQLSFHLLTNHEGTPDTRRW